MDKTLLEFRSDFDRLDSLCGSEFFLNGFRVQLLGIHLMHCEAGWHANKHSHSFFELHYVAEGNCDTTINNVCQVIQPLQFYLIQPGAVHAHLCREGHVGFSLRWALQPLPEQESSAMPINGLQQDMGSFLRSLQNITFIPLKDKDARFISRFKSILDSSTCKSFFQLQLSLFELLLAIPSITGNLNDLPLPIKIDSSTKNDIVDRCLRYVDAHFRKKISAAHLAENLHLSYGHISRVFREVMGMTLNEYINLFRLRKTQYYLRSSRDSLREIAVKTGFSHENYLAGLFKSRFGITPSDYRKSNNGFDE